MSMIGGLYTGVKYYRYDADIAGAGACDDYIETLVANNKQDAVVCVNMLPGWFSYADELHPANVTISSAMLNNISGYVPKNNKCFTYPYNMLCLDAGNDSKNYRYEWFADASDCKFRLVGVPSPEGELLCVPISYNGSATGSPNYTEQLVQTGFPQCCFVIDTYKAWLAQKSTGTTLQVASQAIGAVGGAAAGAAIGAVTGPVGALVGGLSGAAPAALGIAQTVNNAIIEQTRGNRVRGNSGASTSVADKSKKIVLKKVGLDRESIEAVDDFFTRYGYSCKKIKIPNRKVRENFTYTRTKDIHIEGNIPGIYKEQIERIYNNGITFWTNPSLVGNYGVSNDTL